jgi:O-antigen/teichoic acid export membrane protein
MSKTSTRLMRGSALRVFVLLANVLVALFIMPFVIRAVGDRWYGMWALIGSIMGYYSLLDLGLQSATQRFLAVARGQKKPGELNAIIVTSLVMLSVAGTAAILISLGVSSAVPLFLSDPVEVRTFQLIILILGVNVALTLVLAVFTGTITAHVRYDLASLIVMGKLVVQTAMVIFFIGNGYGIVALAVITLFVNIIGGVGAVWIAWKLVGGVRFNMGHFDRSRVSSLFNFGFYAFVSRIAYIMRFGIDSLVITAFLNLSLVTHYYIAARLARFFQSFMISALGIMIPVFAEYHGSRDQESIRTKFLQATRFGVVISTTVAGGILIFGDPFIRRWMGDDYSDAYAPLVFLISSLLFACLQIPSTNLLYAVAKHKFHAIMNVIEAVANLTLSIFLVQSYGIQGVALGTAIPLLATRLFIYPTYVCRQAALPVSVYYRQVGRLFLLTAAGQLPLWLFVREFQVSTYTAMLVSATAFYSVYGLILLRYVLPLADRLVLAKAVPKLERFLCRLLRV